ncbi:MAG: peroxiredoxin [Bacteroidota bacterium]|nr:peroxiredoxin [Bacteroidota bacterium]
MSIQIGDKAPDFKLFNSDKQEVSLSENAGKNVLLLFFPQAFTSVCTTELCEVRDNLADYNKADTEVLAISVDSPFTLAKYKEDQKLNFQLLSDFNKETSKAYNALFEEFAMGMRGVSKRAAFVIDKNGIIQYAEVTPTAGDLPNMEAIKESISKLS